ncbi:MAG: hypothetical protein CMH62_00160 [Nanoarchaeota archaeon]|nr:hypothetical protein [Nanoarchaeota archaeon]|tara:strand:+ start:185 stop:508 length:324 start_codon:yes stop_codon:yes gene_type:complete
MKRLLPSLKEKKRYLAFEIVSDDKFNKSDIANVINKEALKFMGTLDYGKAGVRIINANKNKGIIRVNNKFVNHLKTSLILITNIKNKNVIFKTVKVSGILNKLKEAK